MTATGTASVSSDCTVSVSEIVAHAQDTLNRHVLAAHTGRCMSCGALDCQRREEAVRIFSRYHTHYLPARNPGATRPELMTMRRITR